MADKFRRTFPQPVVHSDGELPTSGKLNSIANQARAGLNLVERAIGDLWNQSGDALFTDYPTQISNLARHLGEAKYLNPVIYPFDEEFDYIDSIGSTYKDLTEAFTLLRPKQTGDDTWHNAGDSSGIFATGPVASENLVVATGDWWLDRPTGRVRTFDALGFADILAYTVDPVTLWQNTNEVRACVIPDPRQTYWTSLLVTEPSAGVYWIHLPPRSPMMGIDYRLDSARYPPTSGGPANANKATTTATPYRYWQDETVNALGHQHYRYNLPKELATYLGTLSTGDQLPKGSLWLYDKTSKEVLEDVIFRKSTSSDSWILEVESTAFDFSTLVQATETEANYNSSNLVLIVPGAPVSRSIQQMRGHLEIHDHSGLLSHDARVAHRNLTGLNPPTTDYTTGGHDTDYPSYLPAWLGSNWAFDDHTSLLSRVGSQTAGLERDPNNNAMLGDLLLANSSPVSGVFLDGTCADDSFSLYFGDIDGPRLFADFSESSLHIVAPSTGMTSGLLITAGAEGTYGLKVVGGDAAANANPGALFYGGNSTSSGDGGMGSRSFGGDGFGTNKDGGHGGQFYGGDETGSGIAGYGIHAVGGGTINKGGLGAYIEGSSGGTGFGGTGAKIFGAPGTSGDGVGLEAYAIDNHAVIADTNSLGGNSAALRLMPQATPTTTLNAGGLFFNSTNDNLYSYGDSTWNAHLGQRYVLTSTSTAIDGTVGSYSTFQIAAADIEYTIAQNSIQAGDTIRVRASGRYDVDSDGTPPSSINYQLHLDGSNIGSIKRGTVTADESGYWVLDALLTFRATSGGSNVHVQLHGGVEAIGGQAEAHASSFFVTKDTTAGALDITVATWIAGGGSDAGDTTVMESFIVDRA